MFRLAWSLSTRWWFGQSILNHWVSLLEIAWPIRTESLVLFFGFWLVSILLLYIRGLVKILRLEIVGPEICKKKKKYVWTFSSCGGREISMIAEELTALFTYLYICLVNNMKVIRVSFVSPAMIIYFQMPAYLFT